MTDRATLIERAARLIGGRTLFGLDEAGAAALASDILDALVPPGEAWIAPWEATDVMLAVGHLECRRDASESIFSAEQCWSVMRSAHLNQTSPEEGKR